MNLSIKNQTLLLVALILFAACFILFFMMYMQKEKQLVSLEQTSIRQMHYVYEKVIAKYGKFYENRIKANIRSEGVKEALFEENKEKLYALVQGRWDVLKGENAYLKLMQFYLPDAKVFLRMDAMKRTVDGSIFYRAMIRDVTQKKLPLSGFEQDENILAYRIAYPILEENRLLGTLELGLSPEFFLNEIYDFYKIQTALYVKESSGAGIHSQLGGYYQKYNTLENKDILKYISKEYAFEPFISLETNENFTYGVTSLDVKDYSGEVVAKLLLFQETTQQKKEVKEELTRLAFLLFLLTVAVLYLIHFLFNRNIKMLEKEYESMSQYKKMIDEHVITATLDLHCTICDVSEAFLKISGYKKSFLLGKKYRFLGHGESSNEVYEKIYKALKFKKNYQGEVQKVKENGEIFWVDINIQPKFRKNVLVGYDVIMHDITDKKRNEELMVTDGLTHIYNRRHFNDIFPRMIQSTKRDGGFLSFLIFDLDHFKLYNDTYGHHAGDNALVLVAQTLQASLNRGDDYCFRLGGEEFAALYKSSSEHDAYLFAQRIRKNIMVLGIKHEKNPPDAILTASFGLITLRDYDLSDEDDIYKKADEYLYKAKKEGRNRVVSRIL